MIPLWVMVYLGFAQGCLLGYLVDLWRRGDEELRLTRRWVLWLGRRHSIWPQPSGCPDGIGRAHGYYVRRWWRVYRRSMCLEPTGTLPGDLPGGEIVHPLSRLTLSQQRAHERDPLAEVRESLNSGTYNPRRR